MIKNIIKPSTIFHKESIERIKILFQFLVTLLFAFVSGALLCGACSDTLVVSSQIAINAHFNSMFSGAVSFQDVFSTVVAYTLPYIFAIIAIAVLSFSVFNYLVSDVVLLICGVKVGFSITLLLSSVSSSQNIKAVTFLSILMFSIFRILILVLVVCFAYRASLFSRNISLKNNNGRYYLEPLKILSFSVITAAHIGALVFTNGIYCAIAFVLK